MPESGGPTTQSGTYFQNTVATWYLARMLHDTQFSRTENRVVRVRSEALEDVDDVVITFERGTHYVQVKENITASEKGWAALWVNLWKQFERIDPVQDRLVIWEGSYTTLFRDLLEMVKRTQSIPTSSRRKEFEEFSDRLSKSQFAIFDSITEFIRNAENEAAGENEEPAKITHADVFELLKITDIVVKGNAEEIQEQTINTYLNGIENPKMLVTILRDLAAEKARNRGTWEPENLIQALNQRGFDLKIVDITPAFTSTEEALNRELKMRKNNWHLLRQQAAIYGAAMTPLHLRNQIDEEEAQIRRLEEQLAPVQ